MSELLHGVLRAPHEGLHGACKVARPLGDKATYAPADAAPTCPECLKLGAVGWEPPYIIAAREEAKRKAAEKPPETPAPAGEEHMQ